MANNERQEDWGLEGEAPGEDKATIWKPGQSLFEYLMKQVSGQINQRVTVNKAIASVLYSTHDKEDKGVPIIPQETNTTDLALPWQPRSTGADDIQQLLPTIPVGHWFREFDDLEYQMRNPYTQKAKDPPFTDSAYAYTTAIYSMAVYSGNVVLNHNLKNREDIQTARGYVPRGPKDRKPIILRPEEYQWEHLHPVKITSSSRSIPLWAGINRVRDSVVRLAKDYKVPRGIAGFTCAVIAFATIQSYTGDEIRKLREESRELIKWYNAFKVQK